MAFLILNLYLQNKVFSYADEKTLFNLIFIKPFYSIIRDIINQIDYDYSDDKQLVLIFHFKHWIKLLKLIHEGEFDKWNWGLFNACLNGNLDIVELMIKHGANDWNDGLIHASHGGHLDIVQLMIEKGADDWNSAFYRACQHTDNLDVMNLLIDKGGDEFDIDQGFNNVCAIGNIDMVNRMISLGVDDWFRGLKIASMNGHYDIVELMINKGADDFKDLNIGLKFACLNGHRNIVDLMIEKGAILPIRWKCGCGHVKNPESLRPPTIDYYLLKLY